MMRDVLLFLLKVYKAAERHLQKPLAVEEMGKYDGDIAKVGLSQQAAE